MSILKGSIFNIQRFSVQDGPGTRTTVFFKGCNLRCLWCHNPESFSSLPELRFTPDACIGCGSCFEVCSCHKPEGVKHTIDRQSCKVCGKCADSCYAGALAVVGKTVTVDDVMHEVEQDTPYYANSGGGVTFSGGEPLLQPEFLRELLASCKAKGISTGVDTALCVPWEAVKVTLEFEPLYLVDIKAADSAVHKRLTGVSNERIIDNLRKLSDCGADIIIRVPYIPGLNDGEMAGIAELLRGVKARFVELLPYHRLGEGKYAGLGLAATAVAAQPTQEEMRAAAAVLERSGLGVMM